MPPLEFAKIASASILDLAGRSCSVARISVSAIVHIIFTRYTYDMPERTTIVLGPAERAAAKRLAAAWDVTPSEAIRRALLQVANEELSVHRARKRKQRRAILEQLIKASKGSRIDEEIRSINQARDAW